MFAFLDSLIGARRKELAHLLYGQDRTTKEAESELARRLSGSERRKFGLSEIDDTLDFLGPDAEEAFVRFFCERRGWRAPDRESPEEGLRREVREARKEIASTARTMAALADRLDRIEDAE